MTSSLARHLPVTDAGSAVSEAGGGQVSDTRVRDHRDGPAWSAVAAPGERPHGDREAGRPIVGRLGVLLALAVVAVGCQTAGQAGQTIAGRVTIQDERAIGPPPTPLRVAYVKDFALDAQDITEDRGILGRGILQRFRVRSGSDPAAQARAMTELMATSLVDDLVRAGVPAQRLEPGTPLPADGWLVRGVFTEVGEGNRLERAVIGFGRGATSMEVQVAVSDLARNPDAPFIVFGTVKDPGEMPGAIVTMNPYMAAAKFVVAKNASAQDVKRTAKQIVSEMLKYRDRFKQETGSPKPVP